MNGPISRTCALSVGWSLARESSFNLVHLHRRRRQWVARSPSHSEIISPSLSLFHSPCSLSLSFPNGRVIRLAPVRWEDEEAVHTPQSWSLSLFHSKSALFPSWDDCARWTTDTGTEGECEGRATWEWGTGWRHRDGGDILCLVKWASPRTKTNPALPSSRPGIDSGCEATRAHKHAGTTHGWMSICDSFSQTTNALFSHAEEVAAAAFLFLPPAPDNRRSRAFPPLGRPCSLCGLSRRGSS